MNRDQQIASILAASSPKPIRLEVDGMEPQFVRVMTAYDADKLRKQLNLLAIKIKSITLTNPAVVTCKKKHGLVSGDMINIKNVAGIDSEDTFLVSNETDQTFELDEFDATALPPYTGGGLVLDGLEVGRLLAGTLCDVDGQALFDPSNKESVLKLASLAPQAQTALINAAHQANSADPK